MGFRFRKSFKAGPLRINVSKKGVGYSFGGKGCRITKKTNGNLMTTASIPGTGLSYVKETSFKRKNNRKKTITTKKQKVILCFLCWTLGWVGAHKFYQQKYGSGLLYLFTGGLLGIGWIVDCITIPFS